MPVPGPSIAKLIGYQTITKSVLLTTQGIPKVLPDAFYTSHEKCVKDRARWRQYTGERRTAPKVRYGAPAVEMDLRDLGEREAKCIHFFGKQSMDPLVFMALQQPNSYEHDAAGYEVKRQLEAFAQRFENTRTAAITMALKSGLLYWDANGNLLPNATGAVETIDFKVPADNQNQLNGIITTPWSNPATDIPLQLRRLRKRARKLTGYPLKKALYGENVPSYFFNNASTQQYLARHPEIRAEYLEGLSSGEIPNGLFGFEWIPAYEAFYNDANDVSQDIWDNPDLVVFTPEVSQEWWDIFEGEFLVPTTINIVADGLAAARSMKSVHGMGGYGVVIHDPPTVQGRYFDTFLPVLKNSAVLYQADVAF